MEALLISHSRPILSTGLVLLLKMTMKIILMILPFFTHGRKHSLGEIHPYSYTKFNQLFMESLFQANTNPFNLKLYMSSVYRHYHRAVRLCLPRFQTKNQYEKFQAQQDNDVCGSAGLTGRREGIYR